MQKNRLPLIYCFLFLIFFVITGAAVKITAILSSEEIRDLQNISLQYPDIRQTLLSFVQKLSSVSVIPSSNHSLKITDSEIEQAENLYLQGIAHFKNAEYEQALYYFDQILTNWSDRAGSFSPYSNPVIFASVFRLYIYRIVFQKSDEPDNSTIVLLCSGFLDETILTALLKNNQELLSETQTEQIIVSAKFNRFTRNFPEKLRDIVSFPSIFITNPPHDDIYLTDDSSFQHIRFLKNFSTELSALCKNYKKQGISLAIAPDIEKPDLTLLGLGFSAKADAGKLLEIESGITRKYSVFLAVILLLSAGILIFTARYIFLLHRLENQKDSFLNIISHELMTPVSSILLYADTISAQPENASEYALVIAAKSRQMRNMVDNLLYLNRISHFRNSAIQDEIKKRSSSIDLKHLAEKICDDYSRCHMKQYQLTADCIPFTADMSLITVILSNLVDNSFKYVSKEPIHIRIFMHNQNEHTIIEYSDNGENCSAIPDIFQKFIKNSSRTQGMGLGLFVVKSLVELMNGSITCENNGYLKFFIYLRN